jgi:hypothetical protein
MSMFMFILHVWVEAPTEGNTHWRHNISPCSSPPFSTSAADGSQATPHSAAQSPYAQDGAGSTAALQPKKTYELRKPLSVSEKAYVIEFAATMNSKEKLSW